MVPILLDHGAEVDESYLNIAVNFPCFLECILRKFPMYCEYLPEKIKTYFNNDYMSFFNVMTKYKPNVIFKMMTCPHSRCCNFVTFHKDDYGQTPLHFAAKYFRPNLVGELMSSRYVATL